MWLDVLKVAGPLLSTHCHCFVALWAAERLHGPNNMRPSDGLRRRQVIEGRMLEHGQRDAIECQSIGGGGFLVVLVAFQLQSLILWGPSLYRSACG